MKANGSFSQYAPDRHEPDGHHHCASSGGGARLPTHHRHGRWSNRRNRLPRRTSETARGALCATVESAKPTGGGWRVNKPVQPPEPVRPGPRPPRRSTAIDNEFLAPALEILETPPSPVRIALIWIISALVLASLTWSYFGRDRHHRRRPRQVSAEGAGQSDRAAGNWQGRQRSTLRMARASRQARCWSNSTAPWLRRTIRRRERALLRRARKRPAGRQQSPPLARDSSSHRRPLLGAKISRAYCANASSGCSWPTSVN